MLLELMTEVFGFAVEFVFQGLFDALIDFASEWLAKQRR
jgi:hypothetical protein